MGRYASSTTVPVSRSRGQIDDLLRRWGVQGIQWTDEFDAGRVVLGFKWTHNAQVYMARIAVKLRSDKELKEEARHANTGAFLPAKFQDLCSRRGQREYRVLHLWLKAAFEAVTEGIITAETVFMPFLVDRDGRTVSEAISEHLPKLLHQPALKLLQANHG